MEAEGMKIEAHILTYNEAALLPYILRHYQTFCSRICIYDAYSTDRTIEIAVAAGAEVYDWDTDGRFNDGEAKKLKNTCWRGTDADWIWVSDADELPYFPGGAEATLAIYEAGRIAVVKPHGYEMFSEAMPCGTGQIYDEIKHGAPDDYWYAKPILFSPRRVKSIRFDAGAHGCTAELVDGGRLQMPIGSALTEPPTYLLHFHHIGPLARIAARYDAALARQSRENLANGWGNRTPGILHAQEKRAMILKKLKQVIP